MILKQGDMWQTIGNADIILVTANATVKNDGTLVMGRGAAEECAKRFRQSPREFGAAITSIHARLGFYGVIILPGPPIEDRTHLGIFQVKYHWADDADSGLIRMSVIDLKWLAMILVDWRIVMNYPGIGNGRLSKDVVAPLIEALPNNVEVWEK